MPSRREFLAGALALAAAACTGGGKPKRSIGSSPPIGLHPSIDELVRGAPQVSVLGLGPGALGGDVHEPIQTGHSLLTYDLAVNTQILASGSPQLYAATDESAPALGPFGGAWTPFTGYEKTHDRSPQSPIPGVYVAPRVTIPKAGLYTIAVVAPGGRSPGVG